GWCVWSQNKNDIRGNHVSIYANRYVAGSGWQTAQPIATDNHPSGGALLPRLAVDAAGNALVIWSQKVLHSHDMDLWANRYVSGRGWEGARRIESNTGGEVLQLASNAAGNAVVVWERRDAGRNYDIICAKRYMPNSGWQATQAFDTNAGVRSFSLFPQAAVDGAGNAVVIWSQSDGHHRNIWANRYTADNGWQTAQPIGGNDAGSTLAPQMAVNAAGNAVAIWVQEGNGRYNIWTSRYDIPTNTWSAPQLLGESIDIFGGEPQVAIDAAGNAVAVWAQKDGSSYSIWTNHYVADSGWQTAQLIEKNALFPPRVAADASGNAVAVWYQYDDKHRLNIWAAWYKERELSK
ncbi:MAG: hypothetical protein D3924_16265, partial [Candidatus Electrothrix sp. AR4]|nr:hypothetical protein [Candidatus Electrothrix sp. AR4]